MRLSARQSQAQTVSTFLAAAILAAHGSRPAGFAASDVRFFFQLFTNFVEHDLTRPGQDLAITQVVRVLARLRSSRWIATRGRSAMKRGRAGSRYVVTDLGLVGLLRDLVTEGPRRSFEEALFIATFLESYKERVWSQSKPALRRALAPLLDSRAVLKIGEAHLGRVASDLEERAAGGLLLATEARETFAATRDLHKTVARLDRPGSYRLHGVRSLGELFGSLPEDVLHFEIERGFELRVRMLFEPFARRARAERDILRALIDPEARPSRGR